MKTLVVLLLLSTAAFAETPVLSYADGPCCKTVWQDGKPSRLIQDGNVSILVSEPSNYSAALHSVYVTIRQDGDASLDVDPSLFHAIADDPIHTELPYLDMDAKAEHDRKHRARVSGFLLIMAAGASGAAASTPQTATVNNSNGTSSTITYTDPNAQANANAQAAENGRAARERNQARFDAQTKTLLRHTTTQKGVVIGGTVYFEGPKHMKATKKGFTPVSSIDIPINGTIYRFTE